MNTKVIVRSCIFGLVAALTLLIFYLSTLTLISGKYFAVGQFMRFWYYIVPLAAGFGVQVSLFSYLRQMHKKMSAGMVAATGTTSAISMIACCTHYLLNILPILGIAGIVTLISAYQVQLFWLGLVFNLMGIMYIANKAFRFNAA